MPAALVTAAMLAGTLIAYVAARSLARVLGGPPWASPVLVAALLVAAGLQASGLGLAGYAARVGPVAWGLKPAVVALGALLWDARAELRARAVPLLVAVAGGLATGVGSALLLARGLGLGPTVAAAFATRTVSTPFAVAVQHQVHGPEALAAAFAVLGGVVGTLLVPPLLRGLQIDDAATTGVAIGVSAHLVGTDWLARRSPAAAAFSGAAMVLAGLVAALVLPVLLAR